MLYRFLIFNSVTAFLAVYLMTFHDALNWMITNDHTYVSLVIAAIYVLTSGYIGYNVLNKQEDVGGHTDFVSRQLLGLGLIGTVVGLMLIFQSTASGDMKAAMPVLMKGIGTAQITTLFGLGSGWLLDLQKWFITGSAGDAR